MSFRDLCLSGFYSAEHDRLNRFYVPVLRQAVAYDRMTGYFRSSALVVAASGLSHFLAHGGHMRLIVGAELADEDVVAIEGGQALSDVLIERLLCDPLAGEDIVTRNRLHTLAWMVRDGRLAIRVGVPVDVRGIPLRPAQAYRYFHSKYGVLTDADGNRIAFLGSDNESAAGWRDNHETFTVAKSWLPDVWSEQGQPAVDRFESHWHGRPDQGWVVLDLPDAVRDALIARLPPDVYAPPPERDPEEPPQIVLSPADAVRLAFVAAAPRIGGGTGVGFATAGVDPWPHQLAIARRVVDSWPRSYLFADEVGLGKTIEVGLVLRELIVSGKARTALLLVPAALLRQWQEELAEKLALDVPRFDRGRFWTVDDTEVAWPAGNPWRTFPIVLASSHLARRRDRRQQVLDAGPWDVVFVDEAHHARRSGSKATDTPNTLMGLLSAMRDEGAWRALYLATATPMQMHPHEAWDLLALLGLHGQWGRTAEDFVRYYTVLREPFADRAWPFLERMSADYFADPQARPDAQVDTAIQTELGKPISYPIRHFHRKGLTLEAAGAITADARVWMDEWLRAHTPMRDRVFRTTRKLLRHYRDAGVVEADTVIPRREVTDHFVPLTRAEELLYERIEAYISRYYQAYMSGPKALVPLGFIMTVYRRRLTSSLHAIRRSLERRLDGILAAGTVEDLLDADDVGVLEYAAGFDPDTLLASVQARAEEISELRSFIDELAAQPPDESKMARLHQEIDAAFRGRHDTVVIFTQYADTMDYVRAQLAPVYGARIACYSGRGGERYDPATGTWQPLTKALVKTLFRAGREVKILIGTDSLSEGLNLQTCGKLINYDMPWNFMRVEQRIGRVDRIGGRPVVEISNYFYAGTVEEQIYRSIGEDFDWFTDVVGPAQPVLGQVEQIIEGVAMRAPDAARDRELRRRVDEIRAAIDAAKARAITMDDFEGGPAPSDRLEPAISLDGLARVLLSVPAIRARLPDNPAIVGTHILTTESGESVVTFDRRVLDAHPRGVRLLTYGILEFDELLRSFAAPETSSSDCVGGFIVGDRSVRTLAELETTAGSRQSGSTSIGSEAPGSALPLPS